ncbi:MAG: hypothetical protein GXP31_00985 [Kiritimatiellaeota bacterium]|nr:hypothetical protein [Kiritimatiellota bacterium]
MRKTRFTLIEILAAMAVLTVLMAMVFTFFASAQKAWSITDTNTRIYENARVVFDLISRDLQCALASKESGREIPFYQAFGTDFDPNNWNKRLALYFVTVAPPTTTAQTQICEVGYQLYTGSASSHSGDRYWLRRSRTCDSDGAVWNFYGVTAVAGALSPGGSNWTDIGATGTQKVIPGVESIRFDLFPATTWNASQTRNELPKAVRVTITLFDPKLMNVPDPVRNAEIEKSKRTFSKLIFLPTQQQVY